ncbi:prephenate dehydratase [Paenarthrobacter aurescens]|uniref:Prephenate dehydratase n=1 Tax=Paenarthrobacter aurescens TaxID=43663 RepID=A0A4Y3NDN9_PAEAU|nr:prephenate dehydratase [Paenarthrobacter aurescens]MDO6141802.1 prephenate dehydratase [Paenarthrobacter aurescens]MDO6149565.1 prephenate dehydratase [Paenarthrobacter aurescens]MDO6156851.1 prephenate dehydratase [Paenarthrobacter aurescens]MDO6160837.1 prephenate dehydratase [Paenarthrobacter aurescens]GEB18545.1 prephenate dehydratase [Paenarthrobacter aurescens]
MPASYTFLGPEGTFTEAALMQVPGAAEAVRIPCSNVNTALERVRAGEADAAMVPIENSVEGGVTATLDAIAAGQELRIIREALVPITFVLVARPGVGLSEIKRISTHGHAWAQCRLWVDEHLPNADYVPGSSTAASAMGLLEDDAPYDAAICAPLVAAAQPGLNILAEDIGDNPEAVTRFILVSRPGLLPDRTGADKTTVVVPLPEDHPGALMEILDQFASRGVNLSRIESRPTGQYLGHYFFSIDADGHATDARVADALAGLHRISPATRFLGSYARADKQQAVVAPHTSDAAFASAHAWVASILKGS